MPVVRFVAAFLLAGWPALAAPVPKDFKKDLPVYFPLNPGDEWVYTFSGNEYRVVARDVTEKNGVKVGTLATLIGEREVATETLMVDAAGVHRIRVNNLAIEPPVTMISFDPKKDNKWEVKAKAGQADLAGSYAVTGTEKVEVPAGKFTAAVVVGDLTVAGTPVNARFWFADGVGQVKMSMSTAGTTILLVLKAYNPAKKTEGK